MCLTGMKLALVICSCTRPQFVDFPGWINESVHCGPPWILSE